MKKHIIIIGAGYGGLATANLFAKAGYAVDVYEKNQRPGGRVGVYEKDGFRFDTGPSWYLMPEAFEQYYSLLGKSAANELDLQRLSPGYRVFFEHDDPITIHGNVAGDSGIFERIEKGAGEKLIRYVRQSSTTYRMATSYFLYSNFERLRGLVNRDILRHGPRMLASSLRTLDKHVSRNFKDRRLKQILEYHAVFIGSSPFEAPALYNLMSSLDFISGVYYPRRGMYSLVQNMVTLGEKLGVRYHYNTEIANIVIEDGLAAGIQFADGSVATADYVISNADLHHTETVLVPEQYRSYPEEYWQKRQPGPSALLMLLGIKGSLPQLTHHSLLFVDDWAKNFQSIYHDHTLPEQASMYVCNPSKTDKKLSPKGHENMFVLVPLPSGVSLNEAQKNKLANSYIDNIGTMIGSTDLRTRVVSKTLYGPDEFTNDYHSWMGGALGGQSHLLKQSAIFRTPNKSKKVKNLFYVGAGTTPGIGLPMCLISAEQVFKRIAGIKRNGKLTPEDLA